MAISPSFPANGTTPPDGNLPAGIAAAFLAVSARRTLVPGQALFEVGSMPQAMYGVIRGELRVGVTGESGAQFFAAAMGPGRWFGEVPLLDSRARVYHASAVQESEVAVLAAPDFWHIIQARPDALLAVTRMICDRYRWALAWIEDANLKPLPARLAGRIIALHMQANMPSVHISQDELASQLGVSRQSVNRQLKAWERDGLLRVSYGSVEVIDAPALTAAHRA